MSSYARVINHATTALCNNKGSMVLLQLHRKVSERFDITEEDFSYIVNKCPRFVVVRNKERTDEWGTDCTIVAKTSLRLCKNYRYECTNCPELHLCKYFVYGNCRYGKGRKPCKFSHDVRSEHNYPLLRECTLHELREEELFLLLLQNDPSLLPEVCSHYNKGSSLQHGACIFRESCTKVHMCIHFVQGYCIFGHKCQRHHIIDQHGRRVLEERGLSGDVIHDLPFIYQNIHQLTTPPALHAAGEHVVRPVKRTKEKKNEICAHFLRKTCQFHDECVQVHFNLPYKWEVFEGSCWKDLRHMEEIERAFCDPRNTHSPGSRPVDFLTMTRESEPVRRLSTVSSVTKPFYYILTTQWLWYYKGDHENWIEYGRPDDKQRMTSVTSRDLEEAYLADSSAEITVMKGHRHYYLSFQDMYQRNPKHNTKRRVRRRPRFTSISEVERLR